MYGEETYWTYSGPVAAALVLRLGHQVTTMLGVLLASAGKHFSSSIYSDFQVSWQPGSTLSWDHSCKISWSFISALGASLVLDLAWCTFLPWTLFHTTLTAGKSQARLQQRRHRSSQSFSQTWPCNRHRRSRLRHWPGLTVQYTLSLSLCWLTSSGCTCASSPPRNTKPRLGSHLAQPGWPCRFCRWVCPPLQDARLLVLVRWERLQRHLSFFFTSPVCWECGPFSSWRVDLFGKGQLKSWIPRRRIPLLPPAPPCLPFPL